MPLYNLEAEKASLGSFLLDSSITYIGLPLLKEEFFYEQKHKTIFKAIAELAAEGKPVDYVTVINKLQEHGRLSEVGDVAYLTELMESTPTTVHIHYYAELVRNYFKLRRLVTTTNKISKVAETASAINAANILDASLEELYSVFNGTDRDSLQNSRQMMDEFWSHFEHQFNNPGKSDITTGYTEIDAITGGYNPTDLFIIAGRPSWGKTSLMLNSMVRIAKQGISSVLFAYEMSRLQTEQRCISVVSGVDLQKIKSAVGLNQAEMDRVIQATSEFSQLPIFIDDNASGDIYYLTSNIRRYVQQYNIKVVFIDYLQRIPITSDDLTAETGKITTTLKTLAKSLGITIVLVSQLSRAMENQNRKPKLSDLRQSGRIEEDADIVLFPYRNLDGNNKEEAEIIIEKNRNGPIGSFILLFEETTTRFIGRD